jgi:hypothetical protein
MKTLPLYKKLIVLTLAILICALLTSITTYYTSSVNVISFIKLFLACLAFYIYVTSFILYVYFCIAFIIYISKKIKK